MKPRNWSDCSSEGIENSGLLRRARRQDADSRRAESRCQYRCPGIASASGAVVAQTGSCEKCGSDSIGRSRFSSGTSFDRVLVDVPCSGTGTLAHNPEIKWRLKPEDLADLQPRQLAILQAAMRLVAPGAKAGVFHLLAGARRERGGRGKALAAEPTLHFVCWIAGLNSSGCGAKGELVWEKYRFAAERTVCENHSRSASL